jgi:hypothetical protein
MGEFFFDRECPLLFAQAVEDRDLRRTLTDSVETGYCLDGEVRLLVAAAIGRPLQSGDGLVDQEAKELFRAAANRPGGQLSLALRRAVELSIPSRTPGEKDFLQERLGGQRR